MVANEWVCDKSDVFMHAGAAVAGRMDTTIPFTKMRGFKFESSGYFRGE